MELIRQVQPFIMLMLSSVCGSIALFAYFTGSIGKRRKYALILIEICAMVLLISDFLAYQFRENVTRLGFYGVRISNFLVFFLTLLMVYGFNDYLIELLTKEGQMDHVPKRLKAVRISFSSGWDW